MCETYPKYDKPLQSKCERTDLYAVELTYPAFRDLCQRFDPEGWKKYKRHTDGHTLTCRVYGRLAGRIRLRAGMAARCHPGLHQCEER